MGIFGPITICILLATSLVSCEDMEPKPEENNTNSTHINNTRSAKPVPDEPPLVAHPWLKSDRGYSTDDIRTSGTGYSSDGPVIGSSGTGYSSGGPVIGSSGTGFSSDGTLIGTAGTGYRAYSTEYDGYKGYGPYDGGAYPGYRRYPSYDDSARYPTYRRSYSSGGKSSDNDRGDSYFLRRYYNTPDSNSPRRAYSTDRDYDNNDYAAYDNYRRRYYNNYYYRPVGNDKGYGNRDYDRYPTRSYLGYPTYGKSYVTYEITVPERTTRNYGRAYLGYDGKGTNRGDFNGNGYWRLSPRYDDTFRPSNTFRPSTDRRYLGSGGKSW